MSIGVVMLDEAPTSLNDCLLVLTPGIYCDRISSRQLPFFVTYSTTSSVYIVSEITSFIKVPNLSLYSSNMHSHVEVILALGNFGV
jgi:hypothetical protein